SESRARIKAEPAERQDKCARDHHGDMVAGNRTWLSVGTILADARSNNHRPRQRNYTTHRMHDAGARKINRPVSQAPVLSSLSEPAAAPDPVRIDAVRKGDPKPEEAEVLPRPALGHRPRGNRGRGVHEHHHEEKESHDADVFH